MDASAINPGYVSYVDGRSLDDDKPLPIMNTQVGGDHYTKMAIQPIEYVFANDIGFAEGNIIKYVSRYRNKNGLEDLKKARHMLNLLIERWETIDQDREQYEIDQYLIDELASISFGGTD